MGVRERVHRAIESAVADADKTLSDASHAGDQERMTILIDGWFRGIADALEELAIEVDLLRASRPGDEELELPAASTDRASEPPHSNGDRERSAASEEDDVPGDEVALAERARAARAETEAVRAEAGTDGSNDTTEEE